MFVTNQVGKVSSHENTVNGFLKDQDIFELSRYLKEDVKDVSAYYLTPYLDLIEFNELRIREDIFNYVGLPYAERMESKIQMLAYYRLPEVQSKSKAIELIFFAKSNCESVMDFVTKSIRAIMELNLGYTKIKVTTDEVSNLAFVKILKEIGFVSEVVMKNEFGMNRNAVIYSYFI